MRKATKTRKTRETDIAMTLNLDGTGVAKIATGIGFLDHMLELFAKHALVDLELQATGDVHVDFHHTVEDVGLVLGACIQEALETVRASVGMDFSCCPWTSRWQRSPWIWADAPSAFSRAA